MRRGLAWAAAVVTVVGIAAPVYVPPVSASSSAGPSLHSAPAKDDLIVRAGTNYSRLAEQVGVQLANSRYATRLAGVTQALKAGGLPVTDGIKIVAAATAPVGKMTVAIPDRAQLAMNADEGGMSLATLATTFRTSKVLTRPGTPTTVLTTALRTWIVAAQALPSAATSFTPLLIRAGVRQRTGVDLAKAGIDTSVVTFSSLEVMLFAAAIDRSIPSSERKDIVVRTGRGRGVAPLGPLDPNAQACFDNIRVWLKKQSLPAEQIAMGVAGKFLGDVTGKLLVMLSQDLAGIPPNVAVDDLPERFKEKAAKVATIVGRTLAVFNVLVKIYKVAMLYDSTELYVDTPLGESAVAPIEIGGRDNSGFVPFAAVVGLKAAAAKEYEKSSYDGYAKTMLDRRKKLMDCADAFGIQMPLANPQDAGDDLENFRIVWKLQTNKQVQWDLDRWFLGVSYPARTTWFARPPRAAGALTKIGTSQAAHVMYARIPAQVDYRFRPSLYEKRTTQAVATAELDFSQPPNAKTLTDAAMAGLGGPLDPFGIMSLITDQVIGLYQSIDMPSADAAVEISYYGPKCSGRARAIWQAVEVCEGRTLSVGVTGEGTVTSNPEGISCDPTCDRQFTKGEIVTLGAQPTEGWRFSGWMGGGAAAAGCMEVPTCTVTMDADLSIEASFTEIPTTRIKASVEGHGVVQSGFFLFCGTNATLCEYPSTIEGEVLTLVATPDSGYQFDGWSGACTGTGDCVVTTSTDLQEVTATFSETPSIFRRLSVDASGLQGPGVGHSECGSFSADGRYLVFLSEVGTFVDDDFNRTWDVFVKDLATGEIVRASEGSSGEEFAEGIGRTCPAMSSDGNFVSFEGWTDWDPDYARQKYAGWVKNLATGQLTKLSNPRTDFDPNDPYFRFRTYTGAFGSDGRIYFTAIGLTCTDPITYYRWCSQLRWLDLTSGATGEINVNGSWRPEAGFDAIRGAFGGGRFLLVDSTCENADGSAMSYGGSCLVVKDLADGSVTNLELQGDIWNGPSVESGSSRISFLRQTADGSPVAVEVWDMATDSLVTDFFEVGTFSDSRIVNQGSAVLMEPYSNPRSNPRMGTIRYLSTGQTQSIRVPLAADEGGIIEMGVTPDGESLYWSTIEALVPDDTNAKLDIYTVRISDLLT